jgi:prevent-host-death family protein
MMEGAAKKPVVDVVWPVAEAKARFSELIESAQEDGPQTIAKRGRPVVVVVAVEEWERKTKRKGTLAEFFESVRPDDDQGLEIPDIDWTPRPVGLD